MAEEDRPMLAAIMPTKMPHRTDNKIVRELPFARRELGHQLGQTTVPKSGASTVKCPPIQGRPNQQKFNGCPTVGAPSPRLPEESDGQFET